MIISLHLPKTAGSSFGHSLKDHFGETFLTDYHDRPFNTPVVKRKLKALQNCAANSVKSFRNIQCMHGHFLPLKYLAVGIRQDVYFITWLREPVDRLISQYYFWRKIYNPKTAPPLHKKRAQEDWSLERFCLGPELRNFYSQFFWGFPLSRFDFIGITEYYQDDLRLFSEKFLGVCLPVYRENTNDDKQDGVYRIDGELRAKIEAYHEKDMALYHQIIEKRANH
jgi:hypothetical protein